MTCRMSRCFNYPKVSNHIILNDRPLDLMPLACPIFLLKLRDQMFRGWKVAGYETRFGSKNFIWMTE